MLSRNKIIYMVVGGFLALVLTFGAFAAFAQTDEDDGAAQNEGEAEETGGPTDTPAWPQFFPRVFDRMAHNAAEFANNNDLLAEALGITVEELEAAQEAVRVAAIEQAVDAGLLTQEQADQLLTNPLGVRGERFFHSLGLLAENLQEQLATELGISVEALQSALEEVQAARLAEKVDAGILTQEQADMIQAYRNVQDYVDYDALTETVHSFYQSAVEQALSDGVITQEQADQMLEHVANLNMRGFPGGRMPGMGGRGGPGGHGGHFPGFAPAPGNG